MTRSSQMPESAGALGRSNRELLVAYRGGDREAAERLVDRTYEAVFASLVRLCGDRHRAADLTQETYRKAWQSLDTFQGRSQVSTWLYRIAYTTFLNHLRKNSRLVPLDEKAASAVADPAPTPEQEAASWDEAATTRSAVLGLPSELRVVVTAHFWGDIPIAEIARGEGVTPVAIRKRLKKALGLIAEALEETER